jgi:DNA-directed RNA polymerase subunit RPC12/RpoP
MKTREVPTTKTEYVCETCGSWHAYAQDALNCEWKHEVDAKKAACTHPEPHYYSVNVEGGSNNEIWCFEVSSKCSHCGKIFGTFEVLEGNSPKAEVVYRALKGNEGEK